MGWPPCRTAVWWARSVGVAFALALVGALAPATRAAGPGAPAAEFFEKSIRPVLAGTCLRCHGEQKAGGGLRVDSRALLLKGGKHGPAVVPGAPDASLLITAIGYQHDDLRMPPATPLPAQAAPRLSAWAPR